MGDQKRRVEVSQRCIGAGLCIAVAPDHFEFVSGGRAQSTGESVENEDGIGLVRTAADACPAAAIAISGG